MCVTHELPPQPLTTGLHKQSEVLLELEKACRSSRRLEGLCRDFELQKVCYIPLNVFILRPLHRLIHYKQILERLCKHYPATNADFRDCRGFFKFPSALQNNLAVHLWKCLTPGFVRSCSGGGVWSGGAAPREFSQNGELSEASGAEEGFDRHWQSCCPWSGESKAWFCA